MCLKHLRIPFLVLGLTALVGNTSGWTIQTHLLTHEHLHGHHEEHGDHDSHDEDHDSDSCGICQGFAKLSKLVPVFDVSIPSLDLLRNIDGSRIPAAVISRTVLTIGFPRAPPLAHP